MISHSGRRQAATSRKISATREDQDYGGLIQTVQDVFDSGVGHSRLFRTDADDLWTIYLRSIPKPRRQEHDCSCCRQFIRRYGGLVTINGAGGVEPAVWAATAPGIYEAAFSTLYQRVKSAKVVGVFLSKDEVWGTPRSDPDWRHLHVRAPIHSVWRNRKLSAGQRMAEMRQNFITVKTALSEYSAAALDQAVRLFDANALIRSEKFLEPVRWLRKLHDRPKGRLGDNALWREIATAPDGFCHVKSSVVGPLLDAIVAGKSFDEIDGMFSAMLHPLRYQRPQALPAAQTLKQAEDLVERLGIARSLERRFARLEECEAIWTPRIETPAAKTGGVFGHLRAKDGSGAIKPVDLPEQTIAAEKFVATVLQRAERIEMLVPRHGDFAAILTAVHADAPTIHKWGGPLSLYVYHGGSDAAGWRLAPMSLTRVSAVVKAPGMPHDEGYVVVLDGAVDTRSGQGNALFPETLIGDLHGCRAAIEAYSKAAAIQGVDQGSACGYAFRKNVRDVRLRAFFDGAWSSYRIDRWS